MSEFAKRLEERMYAEPLIWLSSHPHTREAFMAGARAALELAAEDLAQHDTHRFAGNENRAYNAAMDFVDERLRALASAITAAREGGKHGDACT